MKTLGLLFFIVTIISIFVLYKNKSVDIGLNIVHASPVEPMLIDDFNEEINNYVSDSGIERI